MLSNGNAVTPGSVTYSDTYAKPRSVMSAYNSNGYEPTSSLREQQTVLEISNGERRAFEANNGSVQTPPRQMEPQRAAAAPKAVSGEEIARRVQMKLA